MVRALDVQPIGCRFVSRPLRFTNDLGQVVYTHVPLFTKQYKLVPASGRWCSEAGKVTVGLASHWPCITDSVVYPLTGSMAWEREMCSPPSLHWSTTASLPFYMCCLTITQAMLIGKRCIGQPLSIVAMVSTQLPQKRECLHGTKAMPARGANRRTS